MQTGGRLGRRAVLAAVASAGLLLFMPSARAAAAPDLTVTKTSNAGGGTTSVGDVFTYTVTVTNAGTATAHDVEMNDDLPDGIVPQTILPSFPGGQCTVASSTHTGGVPQYSVFCQRSSLPAGTSAAVSFEVKVTGDVSCGSVTNTAEVSASDEPKAAQEDDAGSVTDTITCPPSVSIAKTAPAYAHVGDDLGFRLTVRNTGGVDLSHVRVTDPGCNGAASLGASGNGNATLDMGETWVYGCRHAITRGSPHLVATRATVTARSPAGAARASDRAVVRVLRPSVTLRVVPDPRSGTPGDTLTYRFVVTNTGDATIAGLVVVDDQLGRIGAVARLVPGHSVTLSADRLLSARHVWVVDHATVRGTDPSGHAVSASGTGTVTIVGSEPATGTPGGGTAFTGSDAVPPAIAAVFLASLGAGALLTARRRHV